MASRVEHESISIGMNLRRRNLFSGLGRSHSTVFFIIRIYTFFLNELILQAREIIRFCSARG